MLQCIRMFLCNLSTFHDKSNFAVTLIYPPLYSDLLQTKETAKTVIVWSLQLSLKITCNDFRRQFVSFFSSPKLTQPLSLHVLYSFKTLRAAYEGRGVVIALLLTRIYLCSETVPEFWFWYKCLWCWLKVDLPTRVCLSVYVAVSFSQNFFRGGPGGPCSAQLYI